MRFKLVLAVCMVTARLSAQEGGDTQALLKQLLTRMDALERENHQLRDEIHALRHDLESSKDAAAAPVQPAPTLEERVGVNERRIDEQAQTKVESSQKFPLSINGTLLFNAFFNSNSQQNEYGNDYALLTGPGRSGATVRQTILGLQFQGPKLPDNGQVTGSIAMDFFSGPSTPGSNWLRIRRADISLTWPDRTFTVGQDKPLISPYQPDSLAEVGVPPLAGSGNLWLWLPQARYEERFRVNPDTGITGQLAIIQTAENYQAVSSFYATSLQPARPALEGRIAVWHKFDEARRVEIGGGFHAGNSHINGFSVPSHIASIDWHITPARRLDFTGTAYTGQNVAGLGALGNGFIIPRFGSPQAVHSQGGWAQLSTPLTDRLTLNLFAGLEGDRGLDTYANNVARNLTYAGNLMYHIGPNVVVAFEALQLRSRYSSGDHMLNNHYDLALGYFF